MIFLSPQEEMLSVRRSALRAGCVVNTLAVQSTSAGDRAVGKVSCPDGWAAARLLLAQAIEDSQSAGARDLALRLRKMAPRDEDFARAVHQYVKDHVAFVREKGEVFTGSAYTIAMGAGDCDDHARLVYAIAQAGGLPAALAFLFYKSGRPTSDPTHAVAQLIVNGQGYWAETTLDAGFGEHPLEAAERLRLLNNREDLADGVILMTEEDLSGAAPDAVALFKLGFLGCADEPITSAVVKDAQKSLGGLVVDGILGPKTRYAMALRLPQDEFGMGYLQAAEPGANPNTSDLSDGFFEDLKRFAAELKFDPVWMLDVMNSESEIRATAKYRHPPNLATGLIGFVNIKRYGMPDNSLESHDRFAQLSPQTQLMFARDFWLPLKGKATSAANLYQFAFVPASLARGTDPDTVIVEDGGDGYGGQEDNFYDVNAGYLDVNKDGAITVDDLAQRIEKSKRVGGKIDGPLTARYAEALKRLGASPSAPSGSTGSSAGSILAALAIALVAGVAAKRIMG